MPRLATRIVLLCAVVAAFAAALATYVLLLPREYATIRKADQISLYEGLPHQTYEPEKLAEELKTKPTVQLYGFPFYRDPLELKVGDAEKLKGLIGDWSSYAPHAGEKKCGGFHPDFAIQWWSSSGEAYACLICFGCHEVKIYSPRGEQYGDVPRDSERRFKALLRPYQKNRPPFPPDPPDPPNRDRY